ncbi:MAG: RlmE family RNA methyltransferase [Treponema sp.]|jgi:23S rRNA (uridine2552-2'-O)-methyltransferase|nr:RlmE family RNA methyltransferase [Treponema sp.]
MGLYEKPDFWSLKAKKEGYPARSVYKLIEMDEKFGLLRRAGAPERLRVLDLGAAPGSWSLYVLRRYGVKKRSPGKKAEPAAETAQKKETFAETIPAEAAAADSPLFLAAADLLPLTRNCGGGFFDSGNFFFIQGDFTTPEVRGELCRQGPYTAIICDAAPGTTGSRTVDTLRSLALAEEALAYGDLCLAPGGSLAVKVFQGAGTAALLSRMKAGFTTARSFKPAACRDSSFETYYIGRGKKRVN